MKNKKGIVGFKQKKKTNTVFLLFVLGALLFWFLTNLSKEYTSTLAATIVYENLPESYIFQEAPPETINLRVKTTGFYFVNSSLKTPEVVLSIDKIKHKEGYDFFIENSDLRKQLNSNLSVKLELKEILLDTLFVKLGVKKHKKVPVKPSLDIEYYLGYKAFSGIKISPDSILVSGPEFQVNKVSEINLRPYLAKGVQESIAMNIDIQDPNIPKLTLSHKEVFLEINVEKITEKSLEIPVKVINKPIEELVIYPKTLKLICQVRLSQFNDVKANDFEVICDYNQRDGNFLKAELVKKPKLVSSVKLLSNNIEYLILK
ncbi:hypothetical protein N9901_02595 [Flavobacteriaceae bacterium]|nr:hypothetical protein [Flavobacteriaceae bacterium]